VSKDSDESGSFAERLQSFLTWTTQVAGAHDMPTAKLRAAKLLDEMKRLRETKAPGLPSAFAGRREYEEWATELFRLTNSVTTRENLLRNFADRFAAIHGAGKDGPWVVVLEAEFPRGDGKPIYRGFYQHGFHPEQWRQFCAALDARADDPLLRKVLQRRERIEQWYLPYFAGTEYLGLFDAPVDTKKRFRGEPNFWLSAQPLFGEWPDGHAVFLLYPNQGGIFEMHAPPGAAHDSRLLEVLATMYRQLEVQIANFAVYVERARRELINQLAPGLLNHELFALSHDLGKQAGEHQWALKQIAAEWAVPGLDTEVAGANGLTRLAREMAETTEAFLNLERRGPVGETRLNRLVFDALRLSRVRLGKIGIKIDARHDGFRDEHGQDLVLRNDSTLLVHCLLNILLNAADAFVEGQTPAPRRVAVRLAETGDFLAVDVLNNGPPIPAEIRERIFERGFTTRPLGHGQGLFLARLIASYAGGSLHLLGDAELPPSYAVGFRLRLARVHEMKGEIGRELVRAA
jgi:hypothetical protein